MLSCLFQTSQVISKLLSKLFIKGAAVQVKETFLVISSGPVSLPLQLDNQG
jgi:hypothetical protein